MIDEKKLIKDIKLLINRSFLGEITSQSQISVGEILTLINNQPKISEWIPCSERLPEKSNSYLVTKHIAEREDCTEQYETCSEIFWTRDNKWDCERDPDCEWKVIAWQPLPAPYEVKSDE